MYKIISILFLVTSLYSSEFSVNPSFQGYTGVINTPNAQITKEGHAVMHFNNQFDNSNIGYKYDTKHSYQEDYIFGVGLFSFMEIQGRLSEAMGVGHYIHRDLSANVKFQLPYHHKYLPDLAIGMQDIGGAANQYDNQYIVMDKELWFLRASVGYGNSSTDSIKKRRMDGLFGALEIKATDWLYVMAEDDSTEQHVALRLEMPKSWISSFNIRGSVARNFTSEETSLGLTIDIPLWHDSKVQKDIYRENEKTVKEELEDKEESVIESVIIDKAEQGDTTSKIDSLKSLQDKLVDFGFENVRVGRDNQTIIIEFENSIFDHTDLDALGYAAGVVSNSKLEFERYTLVLLKNNIQTISMSGIGKDFKDYVDNPSFSNEKTLMDNLVFSRSYDDSNISFGEMKNNSFFTPRVELSLGLTTTIGTEVGVFDYVAALRTKVYMTIRDGLVVSAMYEMPFANSENFDKGRVFNRNNSSVLDSRFVNVMAHQTLHLGNIIDTISVGKYKTDYFGFMNQANYTSTAGEHAIKWRVGSFNNEKNSNEDAKTFSLLSYRYAYAPLDLYTEITYGKYWYGDTGMELDIKRFFGETSVSFNYKDTTKNYLNRSIDEKFAGVSVSFPFTTRKLYRANYIQLKGKNDFYYGIRTTVRKDDGTNGINNNYGNTPKSDFEVTSVYLNRDRLSASYIKNHLDRLRDAYIVYK